MLPYLNEIKIEESKKNPNGLYKLSYIKYEDNTIKVYTTNVHLIQTHTLIELEKKFVELVLQNKPTEFLLSTIEGNDNGRIYYDVIQQDYPFKNSETETRRFVTRLLMWSNYLSTKNRILLNKIIVNKELYKILKDQIGDNLKIYFNKNIPKNKIIYLNNQADQGSISYLTDGELNDIIFQNENTYAVVDLVSRSDIRGKKIDSILE